MDLNAPALRSAGPADTDWVVSRHAALYAAEAGFDATFATAVAGVLAGLVPPRAPAREAGWIAETPDGLRLGCIFCAAEGPDAARLRLFLVEPGARGTGLAQRLFAACRDFARAGGARRLVLSTHASHTAARRLYARNGLVCRAARPVRAYGRDLVHEDWEGPL